MKRIFRSILIAANPERPPLLYIDTPLSTSTSTSTFFKNQVADKTGAKFRSWDMTEPNAFWLYSSSPAKNHGFDVGFTEQDRDLAGKPRLNGLVDMGCYEFHPACGLMVIVR